MSSRSGTDDPDAEGSGPNILAAVVILGITVGIGVTAGLVAFEMTGSDPGPQVQIQSGQGSSMIVPLGTLGFLAIGGLAGLILGYAALGVPWVRRIFHRLLGIYVGAWAGVLIYVIGYITAVAPYAWFSGEVFGVAVQALFSFSPLQYFAAGLGAIVGLWVERYAWRFEGLLAFLSLTAIVFGYIGYSLFVTLPQVPPTAFPLSLVLFLAETGTLLLVLVYAFYPLDILGRKRWDRTSEKAPYDPVYQPKVAFHVPTFNEPPEMVKQTLRRLLEVNYPEDHYTIMVLDDSTDESYIEPVRRFCEEKGITYIHRSERDGYKAGALNVGLEYTPDDIEIIAVIDADYQVDPDYIQDTAGYFVDEELGFLQTPQDYRNRDASFLTKYYYYADAYFYQAVLPSRNEANAIIFCGTMGLVRKSALEDVGGWSGDHVTEDAELATRLLGAGYQSLYLNESYGHGLIPESYQGYRAQHHRWSFGGGQLLRTRLGHILSPRFSLRQKFDHLAGMVHWYDGIFIITIGVVLLLLVMGDLFGFNVVTHHQREVWMVGLIPIFLLLEAMIRLQLALSHHFSLSLRETISVMGMWFSVKFSNMWGAVKGLVGVEMPFIRTPKGAEETGGRLTSLRLAIESTPFETAMGALMGTGALAFVLKTGLLWHAGANFDPTRLFLATWVSLYGLAFLAGPLYAYRAHRGLSEGADGDAVEDEAPTEPKPPGDVVPPAGEPSPTGAALTNPTASPASGEVTTTVVNPPEGVNTTTGPPAADPMGEGSDEDEPSPWRLPEGWHLAGLALVMVLALALRLKDPLSTPIIGAEDPYVHMERTWDLIQHGVLPEDYPPGFAFLLAPFALLGTDGFYWVTRFVPPFFAVVEVLGVFYLCRYSLGENAALGGAFVVAIMPENIFRTSLMFPTALSLALLPFLALLAFRSMEGRRSSQWALLGLGLFMLSVHPWVIALAVPPLLLFWFLSADGNRVKVAVGSLLVAGILVGLFSYLPGTWNPFPSLAQNVQENLAIIAANPSSLWTDMPRFVDLPYMLTVPVLILGCLGAGVALVRRTRVGLFALSWTILLLPLVLVDWFDKWFISHRTVAFLSLGFALLSACFFAGLGWALPERGKTRQVVGVVLGLALIVSTVPAAAGTHTWYRLYDEDDYATWQTVEAEDPSVVVTASWQTHAGYRALTGEPVHHYWLFFHDEGARQSYIDENPDLIVIYDEGTADLPRQFLDDWNMLTQRGNVTAYTPPNASR